MVSLFLTQWIDFLYIHVTVMPKNKHFLHLHLSCRHLKIPSQICRVFGTVYNFIHQQKTQILIKELNGTDKIRVNILLICYFSIHDFCTFNFRLQSSFHFIVFFGLTISFVASSSHSRASASLFFFPPPN